MECCGQGILVVLRGVQEKSRFFCLRCARRRNDKIWEVQGRFMKKLKFEVKLVVKVKQEETCVRRLAKVMEVLKNGKKWTG